MTHAGWRRRKVKPSNPASINTQVAGSGITFDDRGVQKLKGVPGEWHLYAVASA